MNRTLTALLWGTGLADLGLTYHGIEDKIVYEQNPLMSDLINQGWSYAVGCKLGVLGFFTLTAYLSERSKIPPFGIEQQKFSYLFMTGGIALQSFVVGMNLFYQMT